MSATGARSRRKEQRSRLLASCRKGFLLLRAAPAAGQSSGAALLGCAPGTGYLWASGRRDGSELLHPRVLKANVVENRGRVFL